MWDARSPVAAAVRITSWNAERLIRHASEYARHRDVRCYVISVVREIPYDARTEDERDAVLRNHRLIEEAGASPIVQEGDDVAKALVTVARLFGIATLFVAAGRVPRHGRSIAEEILDREPPFEVVVIGSR